MKAKNEYLTQLAEIRNLMQESSRFISLSGLSGIFAGVFALIGVAVAHLYLYEGPGQNYYVYASDFPIVMDVELLAFILADAGTVLILSLGAAVFFTTRKSKKQNQPIVSEVTMRMLVNLSIPLAVGGAFCLVLLYYRFFGLIAPATLIFYGLALLNASKYTLAEIRYLALSELALGLIGCLFLGYGLVFWALGFGVLHIFYGAWMYIKYERKQS